jgi:hypothetical protein
MVCVSGKSARRVGQIRLSDHLWALPEYFRIRKYDSHIENANETVDGGAKA